MILTSILVLINLDHGYLEKTFARRKYWWNWFNYIYL